MLTPDTHSAVTYRSWSQLAVYYLLNFWFVFFLKKLWGG